MMKRSASIGEPQDETEADQRDAHRAAQHEQQAGVPCAGHVEEAQHLLRVRHAGQREAEAEQQARRQTCQIAPHHITPSRWRTTKVVTIAVSRKITVATSERSDSLPKPHTPWPLVQPLPSEVP